MYSVEERQIFRFFDGEKERGIDPIATFRAFVSQPDFDYQADVGLAETGDLQATARVLAAARAAFKVSEFSEDNGQQSGMLDSEVIATMKAFGSFISSLQKKTESTLTSQPSTDLEESQTTNSSVASGSSDIGP